MTSSTAEYDIVYMTRKAMKGVVIVDHLADNRQEDFEEVGKGFLS
jgi:hypothetical protein